MKNKLPFAVRLKKYTDLLGEIDLQEQRVKNIQGAGTITSQRARVGAEERLKELLERESDEYEALVRIIDQLPSKEQRQCILARYMDRMSWSCVTHVIYGHKKDYNAKIENYTRGTFRIHGTALLNANSVMLKGENEK